MAEKSLALDRTHCPSVLERYGRAVIHMRQRKDIDRFGIVLGAGSSKDLKFPKWSELVGRIAKHKLVDASALLLCSGTQTSKTQMLYQHFKNRQAQANHLAPNEYNRFETEVRANWQKIVNECLYENVPEDIAQLKQLDRYLWSFLGVIKNTPLTVNYNFDDTLQKFLADARTPAEKEEKRGYATVWNSNIQLNSRKGVIYHPNGFMPRHLSERPSEHLVFLEDSFADQLIDSISGHYAALATHYSQTTCLFIGLSLEDATLKHLLRQQARAFPGHYHYYIAYVEDSSKRDAHFEEATAAANFDVYNLITLFLTADEIHALGRMLSASSDNFIPLAEEYGQNVAMRFFLTGAVAVGKSTTAAFFRSLQTHDEWLEPREEGMEKDPELIESPEQIAKIDKWVTEQIAKKNVILSNAGTGIHIVDRAPLDAFAFTKECGWVAKAKLLRSAVSPGMATSRKLCPGHVILLTGDPDVMAVRAIAKHKSTDADKLRKQQDLLKIAYGERGIGVTVIDTKYKSALRVAKEVARVIHCEKYVEANIDDWLCQLEEGKVNAIPKADL